MLQPIQLTDKELFLIGSLLELETIIGLEDPFMGHLVEEIEEEWQTIKQDLIIKGILIEEDSLRVNEEVQDLIIACGSTQVMRVYYSSNEEVRESYIHIDKSHVVEKRLLSSIPTIFGLKKIGSTEEAWDIIQSMLQLNERNIDETNLKPVTIRLTDRTFQTARELFANNDISALMELLQGLEESDIFLSTLSTLKNEGQITNMSWNGNEWDVYGKAFLKAENQNWIIHFMNENMLELVLKNDRDIYEEIYETCNAFTSKLAK